jgi:hypothetical protein
VLDPGLGFAKKPDHDWSLLRGLDVLAGLGLPLLVGASRKSFVGRLLGDRGALRPPTERDDATLAISASTSTELPGPAFTPPTSTMSAPSSITRCAACLAASSVKVAPRS